MVRSHVHILIQISILLVGTSQGQQWKNNNVRAPITSSYAKFGYPYSGYYPSCGAYPCQYPYGYAQFPYLSQLAAAGALYPRPFPLVRSPNGSAQTQQQYFLGPMNAAQAQYLILHVKNLTQHGNNTITVPQIPSTPTQNASSIQQTPTVLSSIPTSSNTSSEPTPSTLIVSVPEISSPSTPNESSQPPTSTIVLPEFPTPDVQQSTTTTPPMSVAQNISAVTVNSTRETVNNSVDPSNTTTLPSPVSESILRSAYVQSSNPFALNSVYPVAQDWLYSYNPAVASFYNNLPPQPFYPHGFGPWNPFVLSPTTSPELQPNATQQANSTLPQTNDTFETPATEDTAAGGVLTNVEDFPPQVKEFINMIPDILAMPETSILSPSNNNAVVHQITGGLNGAGMGVRQLGGGSASGTTGPTSYDLRNLQRFKKRHSKSPRRGDHYLNTF